MFCGIGEKSGFNGIGGSDWNEWGFEIGDFSRVLKLNGETLI
jgi:hypothetical protein